MHDIDTKRLNGLARGVASDDTTIRPPHGPAGALSAPGARCHTRRLPVIPAMAKELAAAARTAMLVDPPRTLQIALLAPIWQKVTHQRSRDDLGRAVRQVRRPGGVNGETKDS